MTKQLVGFIAFLVCLTFGNCQADIATLTQNIDKLEKHLAFVNKHFKGNLKGEEQATRDKIARYQKELEAEQARLGAANQAEIKKLQEKLARIQRYFGEGGLPGEEANLHREIATRGGKAG